MQQNNSRDSSRSPLVTIGLHVRNGSDHLREALDSLLGQTYRNFELIISDNASTDATKEICEEYARKDTRIRYIRQLSNIGANGNLDFLRGVTKTKYFMLAPHDDLFAPTALEECVKILESRPDVIAVGTDFDAFRNSVNGVLTDIKEMRPSKLFSFSSVYQNAKDYILARTNTGKIQMLQYATWRTRCFYPQPEVKEYKVDHNYLFELLLRGKISHHGKVLYFARYGNRASNIKLAGAARIKRALRSALAIYTDRVLALFSPVAYQQCRYIFYSNLTKTEKINLVLLEFYAYLRSIWYGHI